MPLSDRDYVRGKHPEYCTCGDCVAEKFEQRDKEHKIIAHTRVLQKENEDRNKRVLALGRVKCLAMRRRCDNLILTAAILAITALLCWLVFEILVKYE